MKKIDAEDIWMGCLFVFILFVLFMYAGALSRERAAWNAFKQNHDCKIVAQLPGEFSPIYGGSSTGMALAAVTSTSAKTGWLCNDGVTYYREN